MTARQYFKAYAYDYRHKDELGLTDNTLCAVIAEKFAAEVEQLIDWKAVTTANQLMNALTERNEKWMALARIFKNNCGSSPIDGSYFRKKSYSAQVAGNFEVSKDEKTGKGYSPE